MSELYELHLGDCIEVMRTLSDASVDSIVTDPPYHLTQVSRGGHARTNNPEMPHGRHRIGDKGFMGKVWDGGDIAHRVEMWAECLRVLKPGGHLLAFAGSRTYHRMTCAIEDAGFEVRDQIMWIYGSGFPKSRNLGGDWQGWGSALKPSHEPICMARKPLVGTIAVNVAAHGTGAINIDACRVAGQAQSFGNPSAADGWRMHKRPEDWSPTDIGRWPANVIHDGSPEVLEAFPDAKGQQGLVTGNEPTANGFSGAVMYGGFIGRRESAAPRVELDTSAARFFYCAKASRADRNEGIGGSDMPAVETEATMRERETADWQERNGNHHPTVKPTDLMAYLCRLVTPPGGVVLDPFMGSGSTGKAAIREGFQFIGIDMTPDYVAIARSRIEAEHKKQQAIRDSAAIPVPQLDLFVLETA